MGLSNGNYPDDIRNYDHDPRSPFYKGPEAKTAEELFEAELAGIREHEIDDFVFESLSEVYGDYPDLYRAALLAGKTAAAGRIAALALEAYVEQIAWQRVEKRQLKHAKEY